MPKTDHLIPTSAAADLLGVHVRTVHRWVDAGRLTPAARAPGVRGALLFRAADIEALRRKDAA